MMVTTERMLEVYNPDRPGGPWGGEFDLDEIGSMVTELLASRALIQPTETEGGDIGWEIANEFWLETTDKAKLAARIRAAIEALRAERDECERQFQAKVQEVLNQMARAEQAEAQVSTLSRQLEEAREALREIIAALKGEA